MKKIILLSVIAASLFVGKTANAQVRVSLNFGAPAYYQPGAYYDGDADYYYMPECGAYYNPRRRLYFYPEGDRWMSAGRLPERYNGYAYGRGNWTRVHERSPWMREGGYNNGGYRGNGYGHRREERAANYDRRDGGFQNVGYNNSYGGYRNNGGYQNDRGNHDGGYNNGNNGNGWGHGRR